MRASLWICALSLLIAAPAVVRAQAVTGSLEGRIVSTQGEPLEAAVVTVSGPFLQGTRSVTTDDRGRFLLLWLPAGTYTVQLRRMGFGPVAMPGVRVSLGTTTSLGAVTLAPLAVEIQEIVVSGARPIMDLTSTANSSVMDSAFFRAIPTQRDFMHLVELVPLAMPSPFDSAQAVYLGANVAGSTELENGYFVDGIHSTELNFAAGAIILPTNFVREVQVLSGGYEAEYGRSQGGVVNVVTHSGGNDFHGQVYANFAGNALRTEPRWGFNQLQIRTYDNWDVGVSVGGRIVRDRLWFFAAYDPSFLSRGVAYTGIAPQRNTVARHLFAGKLTWRATANTELVAMVLGDPKVEERIGSAAAGGVVGSVTDPDMVHARVWEGGTTLSLQARHWFGRSLLTASIARSHSRLKLSPRTARDDIWSITAVNDYTTGTTSGGFGYQADRDWYRTSAQIALTHVVGAHTFKVGADYEAGRSRVIDRMGTLFITADTTAPFTRLTVLLLGDVRTRVPSAYLQDSWQVRPGLRINVGLRWDGYGWSGPNGPDGSINGQLAPRLGVIVEPRGSARQKLVASVGRYYEQVPVWAPMGWTGAGFQRLVAYAHDPRVDSTGGTLLSEIPVGNSPVEPHLRGQSYDEVTAGYERVVGRALKLGILGIYRRLGWVIDDGVLASTGVYTAGNPGRGILGEMPRATRVYRALALTLERVGAGPLAFVASYVVSRNYGNYPGLFATDLPENGCCPNISAEFDAPDAFRNSTGLLPNDRTHIAKLVGSYRLPVGLTVGASFLIASGTPLSEYGTSTFGVPYWTFVQQRGTAGRTPWTWNLDLRFAYDVPVRGGMRPHVTLDAFHVGSPRGVVWRDQLHYNAPANLDGSWPSTNPNYGKVKAYQGPMSARLGVAVDF